MFLVGRYYIKAEKMAEYQKWLLSDEAKDLMKRIEERTIFIGDGVKTYGDHLRNSLPSLAIFPPAPFHVPHGSAVARLGLELLLKGESLDLATFTPLYVRPSEAETKWRERHPD